VPELQASVPQVVPTPYLWQPPFPSQVPSVPQVAAVWSAHWPSGSAPEGTLVQAPGLSCSAHDLHVPEHAVEQQTPCAQIPELHWSSPPHTAPIGFLPQLPPTQVLGAMQSASVVHVVRHWPLVSHWNGAQVVLLAPMHAPMPSQRPADISMVPEQPGFWQTVPAEYFSQAPVPSHRPV
jgi:hypothetical protein